MSFEPPSAPTRKSVAPPGFADRAAATTPPCSGAAAVDTSNPRTRWLRRDFNRILAYIEQIPGARFLPRPVRLFIAFEVYAFALYLAVPLILIAWWISLYPRHGDADAKAIEGFVKRWTQP